jgi:hypothetical protein
MSEVIIRFLKAGGKGILVVGTMEGQIYQHEEGVLGV